MGFQLKGKAQQALREEQRDFLWRSSGEEWWGLTRSCSWVGKGRIWWRRCEKWWGLYLRGFRREDGLLREWRRAERRTRKLAGCKQRKLEVLSRCNLRRPLASCCLVETNSGAWRVGSGGFVALELRWRESLLQERARGVDFGLGNGEERERGKIERAALEIRARAVEEQERKNGVLDLRCREDERESCVEGLGNAGAFFLLPGEEPSFYSKREAEGAGFDLAVGKRRQLQ